MDTWGFMVNNREPGSSVVSLIHNAEGGMKHLLSVVIAVCMATTCFAKAPVAVKHCTVPQDEMQVLVNYLKWSADNKDATVLITTTEATTIDVDYVNLQLATSGHGTPIDVRNDLKRKIASPCLIGTVASVPNLQFMSKNEHDQMFQTRNGWAKFHKRYGKNASIESISRVGFNSDHTIALFYVTGGIDRMGGSCYLYVFRRREGKWVKDAESPVWHT